MRTTNISSFTDSGMSALLVAPLLCPFGPAYALTQPHIREVGYVQSTTAGTKVSQDVYFVPEETDYFADAVGVHGLRRLANFAALPAGWDGRHGAPLNQESVDAAKKFFADKKLMPSKAGVFMSVEGNLVVSWEDATGQLVELEFEPERVTGFVQATELEIDVAYDQDDEQAKLGEALAEHIV